MMNYTRGYTILILELTPQLPGTEKCHSLTQTCTRDSLRAGQRKHHTVYSVTPPAIPMHSARKTQGENAPNPLTLYQQLRNENGRAMYIFLSMCLALTSLKTASMSTNAVCALEIIRLSSVHGTAAKA